MDTFISHNPEETIALGEQWGREAARGWVLGLAGDLGAGKTHLVKGLARGLGVKERVRSPTFALVHEYRSGRLPLFHLDFYRLPGAEEILRAGLDQYLFSPPGVTVVEWAERWLGSVADMGTGKGRAAGIAGFRSVRIEVLDQDVRRISYEDPGA